MRTLAVRPPDNPPLERTAAAVYFVCGRASRVRRRGRSMALRYPPQMKQRWIILTAAVCVPSIILMLHPWTVMDWQVYLVRWRQSGPTTFYGKVVDVSGKPIANASVKLVQWKINLLWTDGESQGRDVLVELKTNAQGDFSLVNERCINFKVK